MPCTACTTGWHRSLATTSSLLCRTPKHRQAHNAGAGRRACTLERRSVRFRSLQLLSSDDRQISMTSTANNSACDRSDPSWLQRNRNRPERSGPGNRYRKTNGCRCSAVQQQVVAFCKQASYRCHATTVPKGSRATNSLNSEPRLTPAGRKLRLGLDRPAPALHRWPGRLPRLVGLVADDT